MCPVSVTTLLEELRAHANLTLDFLRDRKPGTESLAEKTECIHKIPNFLATSGQLGETTRALDEIRHFECTGRIKYREDRTLFVSVDASERASILENGFPPSWKWPVRLNWRVELIRDDAQGSLPLAEHSLVFIRSMRARGPLPEDGGQGRDSQSEDGVCVEVNTITNSGYISQDNSVTVKWTAEVEPFLQSHSVDEYEKMITKSQSLCDTYKCPEDALSHVRLEMDRVLQTMNDVHNSGSEQGSDIKHLEDQLVDVEKKLIGVEEEDASFQQILVTLKSITQSFIKKMSELNI